jgi:hypothetical protein
MWSRAIFPFLLALAQAAVVFAGVYFKDDFSKLPKPVQFAAYAGFALALITPGVAAWNAARAHRERLGRDAYEALLAALTKIVDKTRVQASDIGLHAYLVRRPFPWFCMARQERIARVRLSDHPPPSTTVWKKGKGYIGACWKNDLWADFQFDRIYAAHLNCASAADWAKVPEELRFGMTFDEWARTKAYRLVRVYPIHARRRIFGGYRYVGCISLDALSDASVAALLTDDVRNLVASAAAFVGAATVKAD